MAADLVFFYMHITSLMTSLSCKKFKRMFTLKRGHKGQLYAYKRILNRRPFFNKVYAFTDQR